MKSTLAAAGLALSLALPAMAQDDEGPYDKAIKGRQGMFQTFSFNLGILADMAKGDREYDAELATVSATNLDLATQFGQNAMWPEGSDNSNPENAQTRALPKIWEELPEVQEKFERLRETVVALQPAAGEGVDGLRATVPDVGNACKSCHDDYRAED